MIYVAWDQAPWRSRQVVRDIVKRTKGQNISSFARAADIIVYFVAALCRAES